MLGAALASGAAGLLGQEMANRTNVGQAREQMAFQREMASDAHQREVKDLVLAGLNPILSANNGASVPQGASAKVDDSLGKGVASAIEGARLSLEMKKQKAEVANLEASNKLLHAQKTKTDTESKVMSKGIPGAEIKNDAYDVIRPIIKRLKEALGHSSKEQQNEKAIREFINLRRP